MPQELQMHSPQVVSNPKLGWDNIDNDDSPVMPSRRYTVTDTSDPLDLDSPPSTEEVKEEEQPPSPVAEEEKVEENKEGEPPVPEEKQEIEGEKEGEEEEKPEGEEEEDTKKHRETFVTDLDEVLKEKTGVDLAGITEALVELLTWRNDILSLEAQQKQQATQKEPVRPQQPPSFQRSTSKTGSPNPAESAYDYTYSQILDMAKNNPVEYDRQNQRITQAFMKNRVLMDV